ncbi:MAG: flagellin [Lachnospiraceae bacterium]|nr:flagellin [Lachnospiraceae bacterium]
MRISPIGNNYNANSIYGKIASGKRIQTAADDAAGLAIANKLKRHGNGLDVAANNISDGIGVANIQDGALGTIQDSLQRIRELSLKASNGIYGSDEKEMIQTEIDQLLQDIEGTAVGTQYNEKKLLDGSMADMYIASNPSAGEGMSIKMENATLKALGIEGYNVTGDFDIGAIDAAMEKVSAARSRTGASTNAMYHAYNYSKSASEEMVSSRSRIEDLDMRMAISRHKSEKLMKDYRMSMLRRKMQDDNSLVMRMFGNM